MVNEHHHQHDNENTLKTIIRSKWVLIGFLIVAAYFLYTEHRAHVVAFLPYLLFLACPLMHFFMHGKHGGHSGHQHGQRQKDESIGES